MKRQWEMAGRPSTHYYQGFREIRWESIKKAVTHFEQFGRSSNQITTAEVIKDMMEKLVMRDGFKIGGSANYVIENWELMRHAAEELTVEGETLMEGLDERDIARLQNENTKCYDEWLGNKHYSPDRAEKFRAAAREELYSRLEKGVKA
jgi:hypothetical protein